MEMLVPPQADLRPSTAHLQSKARRAQAAFNTLQQSRLLARIAAITCSSPWTSAVLWHAEQAGLDPAKANLSKTLRDRGIYPPPVDAGQHDRPRQHPVRMRRCDACGRIVPPNNLAEHKLVRVCDDCRIEPDCEDGHGLDEQREKDSSSRAPGAQFRLLMGGCDDRSTPRQVARQRLARLGLTDQEITVLVFLIEGYSSWRIAAFIKRSQSFVRKLRRSAERKVRRSGLPSKALKFSAKRFPDERERAVDPMKLEAIGVWNI